MGFNITTDLLGGIGTAIKDIRAAITGKEVIDPNEMTKLVGKLQEAEAKVIEAQTSVIVAEAQSDSWLTSNWRPITMMVFVFIIAFNFVVAPIFGMFGIVVPTLTTPEGMWTMLQIGLGGYVIGRSGEKIANKYFENK